MKDKGQKIIIILLVANLIAMLLLGIGQLGLKSDLQYVESVLSSRIFSIVGDITSQMASTILTDKYKVANAKSNFSGFATKDDLLEGTIYFELTDNIDIDDVYVVISGDNIEDSVTIRATELGNLMYEVEISLPYTYNHKYYVVSKSADGQMIRLSQEYNIDTMYMVRERAYMVLDSMVADQWKYSINGELYIYEDSAKVVQIEAQLIEYEDDEFLMGGTSKGKVLDTIDITNSISPIDKVSEVDMLEDEIDYKVYSFAIDGSTNAEETSIVEGYLEVIIVITYSDGVVVTILA